MSHLDVDLPVRPFNPDAQIFRPIPDNTETIALLSDSINSLISLSPSSSSNLNSSSGSSTSSTGLPSNTNTNTTNQLPQWPSASNDQTNLVPTISSPVIGTPATPFLNKTISTPVFSPQTFAQTKFGSLKSKHMGRRNQSKYFDQ